MGTRAILGRGRRFLERSVRRLRGLDRRVVSLAPAGQPVGQALLSYILDPFLVPAGRRVAHTHTHFHESLTIGHVLRELGFAVDVIHWKNTSFTPRREYALVVDVRLNLARLAPLAGAGCLAVLHAETSHPSFNNPAHLRRLAELRARRGVTLRPRTLIEDAGAIERADCATVLGNEFTLGTYRFAGKPLYPLPVAQPRPFEFPADKDFAACARRFLWFGSQGLVHKGLDLVLEAFAARPDLHLTVCGPIERERDFERAFRRELYRTPNIETVGWVDIAGERFRRIVRSSLALVYPSCAEGQSGSVVTCMHAGLIPVVPREVGLDVEPDFGVLLGGASVAELTAAVVALSRRPPGELAAMARAAWRRARAEHTCERFEAAYRQAMLDILARFRPALHAQLAARAGGEAVAR